MVHYSFERSDSKFELYKRFVPRSARRILYSSRPPSLFFAAPLQFARVRLLCVLVWTGATLTFKNILCAISAHVQRVSVVSDCFPPGSGRLGAELTSDSWKSKSKTVRSALQIPESCNPFTERGLVMAGITNSPRQLDLLNVSYAAWQRHKAERRPSASVPAGWFVDLSQYVARRPWGPALRCLTRSSIIADFAQLRLLSPMEFMAMHGWPVREIQFAKLSCRSLYDLAGGQMKLSAIGSIVLAIDLNEHGSYWRPKEHR